MFLLNSFLRMTVLCVIQLQLFNNSTNQRTRYINCELFSLRNPKTKLMNQNYPKLFWQPFSLSHYWQIFPSLTKFNQTTTVNVYYKAQRLQAKEAAETLVRKGLFERVSKIIEQRAHQALTLHTQPVTMKCCAGE